ncbi:methyl-accepting chemotaxis protein [Cupriavidus necator]|uniref:methyl-accepting chemotaxis protein n=1 Tax=Cupriavidus necator TaxID=106590 RepID=UPI0012D3275F|nr:methyl-accepting chemotaxis protein [Cupriavidus necator]
MPPWVAMSVGALPLVWYHLGYLTPRAKKGLSQTAIDSVYYFGFLVTIAALGVSAVSLAVSGGKEPLNNIAFQFGLGLFATGYAVIARMHLSSVTTLVDDASPEAVLDRYVQRSRELVTNVELASTQFVQLSNNLMAKSQEVAETARLATERSMLEVARVFDEQLRGTLASARQGLTEIRGLVNETSFVQEREELVRSVKMTLETVNQLNRALSELAQRSEEGARTSEAAIAASSALNSTLTTFRENLERIGGSEGQMVTSAKTLAQAQTVVAESTDALSGVMKELSEMTGTVSGIGLTFKSIKTLTQKANEQMEALTNSSKRLDGATQNIAKSANATGLLAANLDRTAAALPLLAEQSVALERRLGNLGEVVGAVEQQLQALPRPTEEVINISADLKSALASVQQLLACASTEAKSLAGHTLTTAEALEKANRLSHDVAALQNTTESANRILTDLAATVEKLHISLNDSTGSLKSALATATQSLESDVKRSSDAARLFGERLTNVAQIIIDRTKEERPA